jgi:hypothetical protein
MAQSIERIPTKPGLTTRQWVAIAAGVVIVAAVAFAAIKLLQTGDEPPIRVKNGSMDILADGGWSDTGSGWSPRSGKSSGSYAVEVKTAQPSPCPAMDSKARWRVIMIGYSTSKKVKIMFVPSASSKTEVGPTRKLTDNASALLRHGMPGVGYIDEVELSGRMDGGDQWTCSFTSADQLKQINICPASKPDCCPTSNPACQ